MNDGLRQPANGDAYKPSPDLGLNQDTAHGVDTNTEPLSDGAHSNATRLIG
jgi:hypothetical protein